MYFSGLAQDLSAVKSRFDCEVSCTASRAGRAPCWGKDICAPLLGVGASVVVALKATSEYVTLDACEFLVNAATFAVVAVRVAVRTVSECDAVDTCGSLCDVNAFAAVGVGTTSERVTFGTFCPFFDAVTFAAVTVRTASECAAADTGSFLCGVATFAAVAVWAVSVCGKDSTSSGLLASVGSSKVWRR